MATTTAPQPTRTNSSSSSPPTSTPTPPPGTAPSNGNGNGNNNLSAHTSPPRPFGHAHSHSHAGLSSSASALPTSSAYATGGPPTGGLNGPPRTADSRFRASVDNSRSNWRKDQNVVRPASEMIQQGPTPVYQNAETIDRWFEDLQHYEATLEEMAAASLDANFKEELSAIEQWFRVLSEAERTAALYSLLQSSTQVQMRFFVTVLQQMSRQDPISALLSPANPGQASMEAQMEAKLASMGLKSPASPAVRQFARQSLSAHTGGDSYLSPHSAVPSTAEDAAAATTLANQRAKLKASARTSAPANLLLGASEKEKMWREQGAIRERSPSPSGMDRPHSTGSTGSVGNGNTATSAAPTSAFLRTSNSSVNPNATSTDFDNQLSPLVGGSWASMVNTPLVPMFGSKGEGEGGTFGGLSSPGLDGASAKLGQWQGGSGGNAGIVLDDVRKFRRSARVSGGALGGMYDDNASASSNGQRRPSAGNPTGTSSSFASAQQNAINLGLAGLPSNHSQQSQAQQQRNFTNALNNGPASPGLLNAQQAAVAAQQNWRNGLGSPGLANPSNNLNDQQQQQPYSPFASPNSANANAQLANLLALQQQMQMQQLNMAAAAGIALTPVQMMGLQQQQAMLSPGGRMGFGMGAMGMNGMGMGMNGMGGMGMGMGGMGGGMGSPRRSPRQNDRSPGGNGSKPPSSQSGAGSGSNPDEPIDMNLLNDIPSWLRSLRLHKYTSNFEGSNWKEMIMLDDAGLEGKGVSALGARRKLLKVFETVRGKMGMALPGDGNLSAVDANSTRSVSPGEQDA